MALQARYNMTFQESLGRELSGSQGRFLSNSERLRSEIQDVDPLDLDHFNQRAGLRFLDALEADFLSPILENDVAVTEQELSSLRPVFWNGKEVPEGIRCTVIEGRLKDFLSIFSFNRFFGRERLLNFQVLYRLGILLFYQGHLKDELHTGKNPAGFFAWSDSDALFTHSVEFFDKYDSEREVTLVLPELSFLLGSWKFIDEQAVDFVLMTQIASMEQFLELLQFNLHPALLSMNLQDLHNEESVHPYIVFLHDCFHRAAHSRIPLSARLMRPQVYQAFIRACKKLKTEKLGRMPLEIAERLVDLDMPQAIRVQNLGAHSIHYWGQQAEHRIDSPVFEEELAHEISGSLAGELVLWHLRNHF